VKIRSATWAECFVYEGKNSILNSFFYIEPMQKFEFESDTVKLWSFSDSTSSRTKNNLQIICLAAECRGD
jgi:hypothetical protein